MFEIRVEKLINKGIDDVFEAISDHEGYARYPGVSEATLLKEGDEEKNGAGAQRLIVAGLIRLRERIVRFERPNRMGYLIEKATPIPMEHEHGEITLTAEGDATRVLWVSRGHMNVPLLGSLVLDRIVEMRLHRQFGEMLSFIESE